MTDPVIKKVKFDGEALHVFLEGVDDDAERKTMVKSLGRVHPDLIGALQALEPHVRHFLSLPPDWASNAFSVRSVSFSKSEKKGEDGIVISCSAELSNCKAPFFFNTPYLPVERHTEAGDVAEMSDEAIEALGTLKAEVDAYLEGKRAQGELSLEGAAA